jgi:hypothetical protein
MGVSDDCCDDLTRCPQLHPQAFFVVETKTSEHRLEESWHHSANEQAHTAGPKSTFSEISIIATARSICVRSPFLFSLSAITNHSDDVNRIVTEIPHFQSV